jgi:hypothetical protein
MSNPRFIQIMEHNGNLFALDESGQVWWFPGSGPWFKWESKRAD